jgi:hypothetical protein
MLMKAALILNLLFFTIYASIMAQPISSFNRDDLSIVDNGNMGGTTRHIYLIREKAVAAIPAVDPNTNTISTAITFVDSLTEVFAKIEITKDSGDVRHELQGETDGKSFKNFIDFSIPTHHDNNLALCKRLANEYLIAVAQDKNGDFRVLGSLKLPAHLNQATGQTGKLPADNKNTAFILEADDIGPAPILAIEPQTVPA